MEKTPCSVAADIIPRVADYCKRETRNFEIFCKFAANDRRTELRLVLQNPGRQQNGQHTAAGLQGKMTVPLNVSFAAEILPMVAADSFHNGVVQADIQCRLFLQVIQKMCLQPDFVFPVARKICWEGVIVGKCKGICCIVDQLAQRIIIKQIQGFLFFQTGGDSGHESSGVLVIVASEPLKPERTLQICSWISVRFNASQQKCLPISPGMLRKIAVNEIMAKGNMTFSTHGLTPFAVLPLDYITLSAECMNKRERHVFPEKCRPTKVGRQKIIP